MPFSTSGADGFGVILKGSSLSSVHGNVRQLARGRGCWCNRGNVP